VVIWYIFPILVCLDEENSGNPASVQISTKRFIVFDGPSKLKTHSGWRDLSNKTRCHVRMAKLKNVEHQNVEKNDENVYILRPFGTFDHA
jgi:hypothetical protein